MAGKKTPSKDKSPEDGKKKNAKLAVALIIAVVLVLAFTLPLIIGVIFLFAGYEDSSPILLLVGELEITWFAFLIAVFLIFLIAVILILLRDMVHAAGDDRKKKPEARKPPKKDLELYEEKPENRRSFGS